MKNNKITQVTVKQMHQYLQQAIAEGNGDKYLIVSDDNEGNGYHGCFYGVSPVDSEITIQVYDTQVMDPDKLMIIG